VKKKVLSLVVAVAFAFSTIGCASTGGVKKGAYVGLSVAGQALFLIQDTEMGLVCGRLQAPQPPVCVSELIHKTQISPKLAKAFALGERASDVIRAIPPEITGPTPEVLNLVSQIWALITEIRDLIPTSDQSKKLGGDLDKLAAKK
jgi:hypothetical protein